METHAHAETFPESMAEQRRGGLKVERREHVTTRSLPGFGLDRGLRSDGGSGQTQVKHGAGGNKENFSRCREREKNKLLRKFAKVLGIKPAVDRKILSSAEDTNHHLRLVYEKTP